MIAEEYTREDTIRGGNIKPTVWHRVRLVDDFCRVVSVGLGPTLESARRDAWECLPVARRPTERERGRAL